ncbi:MAG: hypothetical protein JW811_05800 [Clostridiales bacterium]|nr:hypothetical protein [Clostridiales bacterium]
MKLYKEMLRKLAAAGLPLLVVTMIYTLVDGGRNCFGEYYLMESVSAISLTPVLQYYVFTAVVFALYGFSFQFSRPASDIYHSLPVKRTDLYLSVLLATATWMGVTIILNVLEMLVMLLVSGCPFVPLYIPMTILFYFVAAMLVFAAAAIGCALSGTVVTALASTGVVLLLPRFFQFLFARGIAERVPIIGWLDFGAWLDPTTNVATGILAMYLRPVFGGHLVTVPHILYSLLPTLAMMGIGIWLFRRRPSEMAQKNGGYRTWTIVTAVLLAFTVMLPITRNYQKPFSVYGLVLMSAALGVFIVYQLIVSPKLKQAIKTLPFFLLAVLAMLGVSSLIDSSADRMLNTTPEASAIESVTFRGYDQMHGNPSYTTHLVKDIAFTDTETKEMVAQALRDAVEDIRRDDEFYDYDYVYNPYQRIEPITIKLAGGGTIRRTIEFENVNTLNKVRMKNKAFYEAVRAFPPLGSVQYLEVDSDFTPEEEWALLESYVGEAEANNELSAEYYRDQSADRAQDGGFIPQGENQRISGLYTAGYVGSSRYSDTYTIRLKLRGTVSLLMRTYNGYAESRPVEIIADAIKRFDDQLAAQDDDLDVSFSIYNYTTSEGSVVQRSSSFYINAYILESSARYDTLRLKYLREFVDLLSKTVMTDDPDRVFVWLNWYYYDSTVDREYGMSGRQNVYLAFEDPQDEQEFITLYEQWEKTLRTI